MKYLLQLINLQGAYIDSYHFKVSSSFTINSSGLLLYFRIEEICDDTLKSLQKQFEVISSFPNAPYFHLLQFKRFMVPKAAKS